MRALAGPGLLALLLLAGCTGTVPPGHPIVVHEHAQFAMFVNGQAVSFASPEYDCQQARICDKVHMHTASEGKSDPHTLHIEGAFPDGIPDWSVAKIFAQYGFRFARGDIQLDTRNGHDGSEVKDQGGATWHFLLSTGNATSRGPFADVTASTGPDYTAYAPRSHDKLLMTYGDLSPAQLAEQESSIPDAAEWAGGAT